MPANVKLVEINDETRFLILPATPPEVPDSGESIKRTFAIDGSGSYSFPAGRSEKKFPLSGTFPGPARIQLPYVHDWRPPIDLVRQITTWCDDNVWLTLLYDTAAENNSWPVFISRYQFSRVGAYGDVTFSMELTELRQAVVQIDTTPPDSAIEAQASGNANPQASGDGGGAQSGGTTEVDARIANGLGAGGIGESRASTASSIPADYMVKPGDSLSLIARKILGDSGRWKEIWHLNPITDPNNIYPGLVLLMPGATTVRTDLPSDLLPTPERTQGTTSGAF